MVAEIRRRAARGRSLASGANRGDWLYSRAVYHFGSWGAAIAAAGFEYQTIVRRPMKRGELLRELRAVIDSGGPVLARDHPELRVAAVRLFGGWRAALAAARPGGVDGATKWTRSVVIAAIARQMDARRPVTANAVRRRDENLYMAGRRRFGSWRKALSAAARRISRHGS